MKVLVVTPWFPTIKDRGDGVFILNDVASIDCSNDVTIMHLTPPEKLADSTRSIAPGIELKRLPYTVKRPWQVVKASRAIATLAPEFDVIHSMVEPALLPVFLSRMRRPWVHTEHWSRLVGGSSAVGLSGRIKEAFYRVFYDPILSRPGEVIAVSQMLASIVGERHHRSVRVIYNHVELPDYADFSKVPMRLGERPIKILGIGGLIERKGPLQAVRTVAELRRRGIASVLRWAGAGPLEPEVRTLAEQLGVADVVQLLGFVEPSSIHDLYLSSDIFLLPTAYETFGIVLAEALSHGLPVITSGQGGHVEFLPEDGSRVVQDRTAEQLSDAIIELLASTDLMSAYDLAEHANRVFSEKGRILAYQEAYLSACQRK